MASQRARATRDKRAKQKISQTMLRAFTEAHQRGAHGEDHTGYWTESGCPMCVAARTPAPLSRAEDFGVIGHRSLAAGDVTLTVWTLFEPRSRLPRVWTVLVFDAHPDQDLVIDPQGHPLHNMEVPAGVWMRLAPEYNKKEKSQ